MTKEEIIDILKERFIERFGKDVEVDLNYPICCVKDYFSGNGYIDKVRYNGVDFEYYLNYWNNGWKSDKKTFNRYAMRILSDCLDVIISKRTEYFFAD